MSWLDFGKGSFLSCFPIDISQILEKREKQGRKKNTRRESRKKKGNMKKEINRKVFL